MNGIRFANTCLLSLVSFATSGSHQFCVNVARLSGKKYWCHSYKMVLKMANKECNRRYDFGNAFSPKTSNALTIIKFVCFITFWCTDPTIYCVWICNCRLPLPTCLLSQGFLSLTKFIRYNFLKLLFIRSTFADFLHCFFHNQQLKWFGWNFLYNTYIFAPPDSWKLVQQFQLPLGLTFSHGTKQNLTGFTTSLTAFLGVS